MEGQSSGDIGTSISNNFMIGNTNIVYKCGKKHLAKMKNDWYLVNIKKSKCEKLEIESKEGNSIIFNNGKKMETPEPDPEGIKIMLPKYGKKDLQIEFSFDIKTKIEEILEK